MAKKVFYLNVPGVVELRNSPEVTAMITNIAKRVQSAAGSGYVLKVHVSGGRQSRTWGTVYPDDIKARVKNARTNALLKAFGSVKV